VQFPRDRRSQNFCCGRGVSLAPERHTLGLSSAAVNMPDTNDSDDLLRALHAHGEKFLHSVNFPDNTGTLPVAPRPRTSKRKRANLDDAPTILKRQSLSPAESSNSDGDSIEWNGLESSESSEVEESQEGNIQSLSYISGSAVSQ
jgi:hypothetical protein